MDPGFRRDDDKEMLAVFSPMAVRAGAPEISPSGRGFPDLLTEIGHN
jgi:hypothetical protein